MKDTKILGYDLENAQEKEELMAYLAEQYQQGHSMKEALKVPDEQMENLYALAYAKYKQGDYAKAADCFRYLLYFDTHSYRYLLGLAASLHKLEEYEGAANMYLLAAAHCPRDPVPLFHGAECFIKCDQLEIACAQLDVVVKLGTLDPRHSELKQRAMLLLENYKENK